MKRILSKIRDEETLSFDDEIEEVSMIGRNDSERVMPMRVTVRPQTTAKEILEIISRQKRGKEFRGVFIMKSLTEEERGKVEELQQELRMRNEEMNKDGISFLESDERQSGKVIREGSEFKY